MPSFFVEEEDVLRINVDILFDKDTGKLVAVTRSGVVGDKTEFKALGFTEEWFDFSPVGYEQMSRYRQQCTSFRADAGTALVDPVGLRNYLIVWHLKDWSIRDRDGKKIDLEFSDNGSLTEESIRMVYKTNTTMLDVVLTLFEKDMMM
jgi:hypothetical protein